MSVAGYVFIAGASLAASLAWLGHTARNQETDSERLHDGASMRSRRDVVSLQAERSVRRRLFPNESEPTNGN